MFEYICLEHFEEFPLENRLDKCDDRVPLPINLLAQLAFQHGPVLIVFVLSVTLAFLNFLGFCWNELRQNKNKLGINKKNSRKTK